jgi:integrase
MLRAAGEAGLRRGEVSGLRWPDVDLAARRLSVRRAIVQERKTEHSRMRKVERTTKGRRARRVAITAAFAARLGEWYEESVIGQGASADGYVWHGKDGGAMHDRSFARAVERACIRAGLVEHPDADREAGAPLVTPHGLRHTCASIMLSQGVSLIVVSRQLGHANPNITAMIYAHLLSDTQLDEAAAVFEAAEEDVAMRAAMREELADA